jgi:hypothetical protein
MQHQWLQSHPTAQISFQQTLLFCNVTGIAVLQQESTVLKGIRFNDIYLVRTAFYFINEGTC